MAENISIDIENPSSPEKPEDEKLPVSSCRQGRAIKGVPNVFPCMIA